MATKMGATGKAAGVSIELKDNSAYTLISNPKATAGIVGFAPKGELNTIQTITNTSELTTYFGLGYNNSRYNQALYAARAVLDAGGYVEFVRLYGEEIDVSDARKRDLKTDTFVVAYDRDPMNKVKTSGSNADNTSLKLDYFAATRYKTDGAASYGVTRKINNIAEAVVKNSNVNFSINATDYATLSSKSRGDTDTVMFALMCSDPSSANRAYTSFAVTYASTQSGASSNIASYEFSANPTFAVGSVLYAPAPDNSTDVSALYPCTVTKIVDKKVTVAYESSVQGANMKVSALFYYDGDGVIDDGFDYVSVRTAAAGRGSKLFGAITGTNVASAPDGSSFMVYDSNMEYQEIRLNTGKEVSYTVSSIASDTGKVSFSVSDKPAYNEGETLKLVKDEKTGTYTVDSITLDSEKKTYLVSLTAVSALDGLAEKDTVGVTISEFNDDVPVIDATDSKTFIAGLKNLLTTTVIGYGTSVTIADIEGISQDAITVTKGDVFNYSVGDRVAVLKKDNSGVIVMQSKVTNIDGYNSIVTIADAVPASYKDDTYCLVNLTTTNRTVFTIDDNTLYIVGNYANTVAYDLQQSTAPVDVSGVAGYVTYTVSGDSHIVESSEKVLIDSSIGATFISYGLATIRYMDVNYTGSTSKVYDLTEDGEAIARLYIGVTYKYNGTTYDFEGTIVPYVYNGTQLHIADSASNELVGSGVTFVLNDSGDLDAFLEDNSYDLSGTIVNGKPSSSIMKAAFNDEDPAFIHNAIWSYDPKNNNSTSTISSAYTLFLDKDESDVSFFVGAGMGVNNFGLRGYETLNTQVIQAILNVCELRKDCFALFDGVAETDIEKAINKDMLATRFDDNLARWGFIYDARPVFYDSVITLTNVEAAPSIAVANLIVGNRSDGIYWRPPSGKDSGRVPSAWCTTVKNRRKFTRPEDTTCDVARLSGIHVNPFRTNSEGMYIWMDYTMQMSQTAFDQAHVTMLIAGLHKTLYHYLDGYVFQLNSVALRSNIQTSIQAQLDQITNSTVPGFSKAECTCDDTNNTAAIINQNKLIVDIELWTTKTARYITLRTTVESSDDGNNVTTTMN